jgi:hypothetical protein
LHSRRHSINEFEAVSKTIYRLIVGLAAGIVVAGGAARGAEPPAQFLGANSCASSSCHGGGGANQNQFIVWSLKDFHSERPVATLATARAKQIADAAGIQNAAADERCTSCHAPLTSVPENLHGKEFKPSEGVSCESCHGPAGNWIRSHTRTDYTRADRTASGMRDLQNLYVRANTCVACHQNVDAAILAAGHPELMFELDGQTMAEPKHWQEATNWSGAHAWYVGQAVALREMSWQLANEKSPTEDETNRWAALFWVLVAGEPANLKLSSPTREDFARAQIDYDNYAQKIATAVVGREGLEASEFLRRLAGTSADFRDSSISQNLQARRAERLVLALDRLVAALPELKTNGPVQSALNQLFKLAQSIPDFDPKQFAAALQTFSTALPTQP